ncbi:hypothetical protein B0T16DRAFT_410465 [Cercophora newfieldiana]|uniref:Uncharacterized protein n=1 Tax=Cercophora newfieldiana TaxID=92897 RepID=A0AA40CT19_9PEZI|nr:hypothetical protein B0T16DRAFT_410465 [Cercophora newfieldiana]
MQSFFPPCFALQMTRYCWRPPHQHRTTYVTWWLVRTGTRVSSSFGRMSVGVESAAPCRRETASQVQQAVDGGWTRSSPKPGTEHVSTARGTETKSNLFYFCLPAVLVSWTVTACWVRFVDGDAAGGPRRRKEIDATKFNSVECVHDQANRGADRGATTQPDSNRRRFASVRHSSRSEPAGMAAAIGRTPTFPLRSRVRLAVQTAEEPKRCAGRWRRQSGRNLRGWRQHRARCENPEAA